MQLCPIHNIVFITFVKYIADSEYLAKYVMVIGKQALVPGSGTFLAKRAIKPTYFELYYRESHITFFNT